MFRNFLQASLSFAEHNAYKNDDPVWGSPLRARALKYLIGYAQIFA